MKKACRIYSYRAYAAHGAKLSPASPMARPVRRKTYAGYHHLRAPRRRSGQFTSAARLGGRLPVGTALYGRCGAADPGAVLSDRAAESGAAAGDGGGGWGGVDRLARRLVAVGSPDG